MIKGSFRVDLAALLHLVDDAGLTGSEFCRRSGIKKDTWLRIKRGQVHVTPETAQQLHVGLTSLLQDGPESRLAEISQIVVELPRGHVKIMGAADDTREKLRRAARAHGVTTFAYLVDLFERVDDPLRALADYEPIPA